MIAAPALPTLPLTDPMLIVAVAMGSAQGWSSPFDRTRISVEGQRRLRAGGRPGRSAHTKESSRIRKKSGCPSGKWCDSI
jgi:hypothetical protein